MGECADDRRGCVIYRGIRDGNGVVVRRCGCEYGEDCTKVSLCALNEAVAEKEEEISWLRMSLQELRDELADAEEEK